MEKIRFVIDKFPMLFASLIIILLFVLNKSLFLCLSIIMILATSSKYLQNKQWVFILIFAVAFLNRIIAVYLIDTPMRSDFLVYYESAQMFAQHKSYLDMKWAGEISNYWEVAGYNNGIVIFYGRSLRIYNSAYFLKFVNSLLEAGTCSLIYAIAKSIFINRKGAVFAALVYAFYPFSVLYVTVLSNQQSSLFFLMTGLAIIFCKGINTSFRYLFGGVFIGLAYVLRPDVVLYIMILVLCLLISTIMGKSSLKEGICNIVQLLLGSYSVIIICSTLIVCTGVNPIGLSLSNSEWKFVVGLNLESRGKWSRELAGCLEQGLITKEYLWQEVKGLSLREIISLFNDKIKIFWSGNANNWSIGHCTNNTLREFIYSIDKWYWGIALLLGGLGNIKILLKEYCRDIFKSFFAIGVICVSIVFMIIEVQERYRYAFLILFIIPLTYIYDELEIIIQEVFAGFQKYINIFERGRKNLDDEKTSKTSKFVRRWF